MHHQYFALISNKSAGNFLHVLQYTKSAKEVYNLLVMAKIRKALIPAAGFGTRFLPQTKAMHKEMMPLVDKPIIQRVVEELVEAGIETIVIVTGWNKRSIEDHFDNNFELEEKLSASGKEKELEAVR